MKKLLLTLALLLSAPVFAEKLPVIASFSILGDLVSAVGGEKVAVTTLVGPDQDAHVYQPAPRDVQALKSTKIVFTNGLGFEGWLPRLLKSAHYQGASVVASQGIQTMTSKGHNHGHKHHHDQHDPHAWQDPVNVQTYVNNIAAALERADAANAAYYRERAARYVAELKKLEDEAKVELATIPAAKRKVIASHDAFGYLTKRFGITFLTPQGVNTDAEASARDVAKLIRQIKTQKIRAVFVENISNPKLTEQLAREAGVEIGGRLYSDALSKADGPASTYLAMYRHNMQTLIAGMRKN